MSISRDNSECLLPAQWLSSSSDISARVAESFANAAHYLSRPDRFRRLRLAAMALLCLWLVVSLARLIWALVPSPAVSTGDATPVINPAVRSEASASRPPVDIERLREHHLFGDASAAGLAEVLPPAPDPDATAREGIEDGARESQLQLTLHGIVSASEDGLGHAIIEHRNRQAVYAVDDELPVASNVVLAKVMPGKVVIDNNGTYELLTLYEMSELDSQAQSAAPSGSAAPTAPRAAPDVVDKRSDTQVTAMANDYREQLYRNPQSLAEVVRISAVRDGGELRGYRIAPGSDAEQFSRLGFKAGDIVTGINGIALSDPAQAMRVYQTMRTASEAVFDVQRGDQSVSVSISLDSSGG